MGSAGDEYFERRRRLRPDREIAQRIGVAPSTLCRNKKYQRAKTAYLDQVRKVVRKSQFKKRK
jgi:hypothetical protein